MISLKEFAFDMNEEKESVLKWTKIHTNSDFLPRWGHNTIIYNDLIYIFG